MIPLPAPAEVHLHLVSLDRNEADLHRLRAYLSRDELERAERLRDPQAASRFIAGRGFLREILADYLGTSPGALSLTCSTNGKPGLAEDAASDLRFNLSHSAHLALLAVTSGSEVGVDLEMIRHDLEFAPMARRYFSPREQSELFSLPVDEQLHAFYRGWTRKEAFLKWLGSGFAVPTTSFDVSLLPGQPPALLAHRLAPATPTLWALIDLDVPAGFCAALALKTNEPVAIRMIP